jgi:hypothetical protein
MLNNYSLDIAKFVRKEILASNKLSGFSEYSMMKFFRNCTIVLLKSDNSSKGDK